MSIASQIAAAKAKVAYWSAKTGGLARRWLKYWSDKLTTITGTITGVVPSPNGGGPPPPLPLSNTLAPAAPTGITAVSGTDEITTTVMQAGGPHDGTNAGIPVAAYIPNVDGSDQAEITAGVNSNVQAAHTLVKIGSYSPDPTMSVNGLEVTVTCGAKGYDAAPDALAMLDPEEHAGDFDYIMEAKNWFSSVSADGNPFAAFGIMVRRTTAASLAGDTTCKFFTIGQSLTWGSKQTETTYRNSVGADKVPNVSIAGDGGPRFYRVARRTSTLTAYQSTDGGGWTLVDTFDATGWGTVVAGIMVANLDEYAPGIVTGVAKGKVDLPGTQSAISATIATVSPVTVKWRARNDSNIYSDYSPSLVVSPNLSGGGGGGGGGGGQQGEGTVVAVSDQTLREAGYILVKDYNVFPNSSSQDSLPGLRQARDDAFSQQKPLFFHGDTTYYISDTLRFFRIQSNGFSPSAWHNCFGSYVGARCKIKLMSSATGFDNPAQPRPVVIYAEYDDGPGGGSVNWETMHPYSVPNGYGSGVGNTFREGWSNIDIDTNGHAGAVGMTELTTQKCFMGSMKVTATGSYAGIFGGPCTGSPNTDIEVVGGQYGLINGDPTGQNMFGSGSAYFGLKLTGQTVACFGFNGDFVPLLVVGGEFQPAGGGVVGIGGATFDNPFIFIDCKMTQASGTVFNNPNEQQLYFRNVWVNGTGNFTKCGGASMVTGSGTWYRVNEYCSSSPNTYPDSPFWSDPRTVHMWSLIDGSSSSSNTQPINSITNSAGTPPTDFLTKHCPLRHTIEHGAYIDAVKDYGATPYTGHWGEDPFSPSMADQQAALRNAIVAATAAGHGRVLVPRGVYHIASTLVRNADTKLFGVGMVYSQITSHPSWVPTGRVFLNQTANSAAATSSDSQIGFPTRTEIGTYGGWTVGHSGDLFGVYDWRAGRYSQTYMADTSQRQYYYAGDISNGGDRANSPNPGRYVYQFTLNGGGRHWGTYMDGRFNINPGYRAVYANGTTEPLAFYALNMEAGKGIGAEAYYPVSNMEFVNCQNVRLYQCKREGGVSSTAIFDGCTNAAFYSSGNLLNQLPNGYMRVKGASNGILGVGFTDWAPTNYQYNGPTYFVYDESLGGSNIRGPDWISIYKKGTTDDTLMVFT